MKKVYCAFLLFFFLPVLAFANEVDVDVNVDSNVHHESAISHEPDPNHDATQISGVLNIDTTFTRANSPYVVTAPLLVNNSVTLTIQPGVTVYLNRTYIRVAGTLIARGTISDPIWLMCIGNAKIQFFDSSTDWNEQSGSGSIIENAFIPSWTNAVQNIYVEKASPKIHNCTVTNNASSRVIYISDSASTISKCTIIGGSIGIVCTSPTTCSDIAHIVDNVISGCDTGISISSCSPVVERNLIVNNNEPQLSGPIGIKARGLSCSPVIRDNTIAGTVVGFQINDSASPNISFNNILDVKQRVDLWMRANSNVEATYNWWGTTDVSVINQSIKDFKNDFNLGKVSFVPFLTKPNPKAPDVISLPDPFPQPDTNFPSKSNPDLNTAESPDIDVDVDVDIEIEDGDINVDVDVKVDSETKLRAKATQLSICVDVPSDAGSVVNVTGRLVDVSGNPVASRLVTVSYSVEDNNWIDVGSAMTNIAGEYAIQWNNTEFKPITLKAEWSGDTTYLGTSATTTFSLLPHQNQALFFIESNSTVTALEFDGINPNLSFVVSGPDGTVGYIRVTIPNDLLQTEDWTVFVDEVPVNPTITKDINKTFLYFTYRHSTHVIEIVGTSAFPEFLALLVLLLFAFGAIVRISLKKYSNRKD